MKPAPNLKPSEHALFDQGCLVWAQDLPVDSHVRRLLLSDSPEAMNMRRVLAHCWQLAADSQDVLRKGLLNERWGQHAGAMAHLLAAGVMTREGFELEFEPRIGKQSPDLMLKRPGLRILAEVRSITGRGENPWDHSPECADSFELPRASPSGKAGPSSHARHDLRREADKREARARARKRAAERTAAEQAEAHELSDSVVRVLEKKAAAYKELCLREALPYIICIYQDTDSQLTSIIADWAFGEADREQDPEGEWHSTHDPSDGTFFGDRWHFGHVSAVLVFGRRDDEEGRLFMRGDLILNPWAEHPLPSNALFPHLRIYRQRSGTEPPRMHWTPMAETPFEITPHP